MMIVKNIMRDLLTLLKGNRSCSLKIWRKLNFSQLLLI